MLRDYQQRAINQLYDWFGKGNAGHPCMVLPTGCHAKGHTILMADGRVVPVETVMIGDKIMGPDGKARTVLHLHRGRSPMLYVKPTKGDGFTVNADHIFSLYMTPAKAGELPSYTDMTYSQMQTQSAYFRHRAKLWRSGPVEFHLNPVDLPISPWALGALIGDGSLINGTPTFCTPDQEVLAGLTDEARKHGCEVHKMAGERTASVYSIVDPNSSRTKRNAFVLALEAASAWGCSAAHKLIHPAYKTASVSDRLELIAGLIDTDGHLSNGGFDWISKSETLADDMVFLCRSVGLAAYKAECVKGCQNGFTGTYYRVSISGDCERIPTRVPHKQAKPRRQKKNWLVTGFKIYPADDAEYYGFEVDGDHLYLDGTFTVHHNSGKSHLVAALCKDALQSWPETRILMLTHVKELIEQNAQKMRQHWPNAPMGIYSASVGQKRIDAITFGGIQSLRTKANRLGHIDLVLIDECHLVNHKQEGGYRQLIDDLTAINPALRIIGLTATPYRLGHGLITDAPALFSDLIEPVTIEELIHKGHLAPLRSKITTTKLDVSGVHKRGGEYVEAELQAAVDQAHLTDGAVDEVIRLAGDRRSWLFFCSGVQHARHVCEALQARGIEAACVTGDTPKAERARLVSDFRDGRIKALTNANVLTTGFDAPDTDLVVMMRPTMSASLYVQMAGRGMRPKSHTDHCLVLDFAGVVQTHGPITAVEPPRRKGNGAGDAPVKVCPDCDELVHISVMECPSCGHVWERQEKTWKLRQDDIMGLDAMQMTVTDWTWRATTSRNSGKEMLTVTYYGGLADKPVVEYILVRHGGDVGQRALRTLLDMAGRAGVATQLQGDIPLEDAATILTKGKPPARIEYRRDGKFFKVTKRGWDYGDKTEAA